jgi:membrane fusion protein, peptide pheromone/bacteriocin exporter
MQHPIYPPEIIENSAEVYVAQISTRSQIIYVTILVAVIAALVSLPLIRVHVSVQSPGIIRPLAEKNEVNSLIKGEVKAVLAKENQRVTEGQELLVIESEALDSKLKLNRELQTEKQTYLQDLRKLVKIDTASLHKVQGLSSPLYRQQYNQFIYYLSESSNTRQKKARELVADKKLFEDKVIAPREYENKLYEYENARAYYLSVVQQQISQWQTDLATHTRALAELVAEEKQLVKEKELYTIKAPVTGTLQQFAGISSGSYIQAGQVLGVLSPDSELLVECYLPPRDIGFIRVGMPVNFQVDAFNYNEWGLVSGEVIEMAGDIEMVKDQPVFKVKCRLDKNFLQLKNGYRGTLKKGMTVRARYLLTERSLYSLLFEQANSWVNPLVSG